MEEVNTGNLLKVWLDLDQTAVLLAPEEGTLSATTTTTVSVAHQSGSSANHALPVCVYSHHKNELISSGRMTLKYCNGWIFVVTGMMHESVQSKSMLSAVVQLRPLTADRVALDEGRGWG